MICLVKNILKQDSLSIAYIIIFIHQSHHFSFFLNLKDHNSQGEHDFGRCYMSICEYTYICLLAIGPLSNVTSLMKLKKL